ncbi:hypothetical protein QA601_09870 [Chitinispirillales bacterium ANBcel5]|uniref:symporter small accessory protein n=1 Tax=Cellulosispirillum alkaliphilum TaxID=3039283 RepID=UPI002A51640F|nr:hypothetical protein [Chitinispirillales bacterium ANBcel5]
MFMGIEGTGVLLAYLFSILSALLCVAYGIINWNKPGDENEKVEIEEEIRWEQHEPELMESGRLR